MTNDNTAGTPQHRYWRWCRVPLPTLRGWLVILVAAMILLVGGCRQLHPFLAVTDHEPGGLLVVEGWAPDAAYRAAVAEFNAHSYDALCVTGGPIEYGAPLSQHSTYADRGASIALALGLGTNVVRAIPAPPVRADRTYVSAKTLKQWVDQQPHPVSRITVLTLGPHARRSRLLFQQAFGSSVQVGIISVPALDYDPARWWRTSAGVRTVIGELLSYGYARLLFNGS